MKNSDFLPFYRPSPIDKDPSTTLRIYAQATVEGKQKVVDLVNFSEPAGEIVELHSEIQKKS